MIEVIDLEKHFGDNEVLKGINVTVDKGDIMVVIGPSGSGKSTFLRCLNCMEDPTGGQIIFNGVDIADPKVDINIHRRRMGMVFQHFNLYNNKTVIQNIMLAPVYVQCQDLKKAKRHNRFLPLTNLFRKEKQEKIEITTTKAKIVAEAKEKAEDLLKRIGLLDKADAGHFLPDLQHGTCFGTHAHGVHALAAGPGRAQAHGTFPHLIYIIQKNMPKIN